MRHIVSSILVISLSSLVISCQSGGISDIAIKENDNGSQPINTQEEAAYKRAILKCYKTGGTRVVKITGKLRCY